MMYSSILKGIRGDNMHPGTKQVVNCLLSSDIDGVSLFFVFFSSFHKPHGKTQLVSLAAKIRNFHHLCNFHSRLWRAAVTCCRPTTPSFCKSSLRLFFFSPPVSLGLLLPMRTFVAGLPYFPRRRLFFTRVSPPDARLRVVHEWWRVCGAELFASSAVM